MNRLNICADYLSVMRLRRFSDKSEAFRKSPVLKANKGSFLRVGKLIFCRIKAVGRWEAGDSSIELSTKLRGHSLTSRLCEDRFHG